MNIHWFGKQSDTANTMCVPAPAEMLARPVVLWRCEADRERSPLRPFAIVDGALLESSKTKTKRLMVQAIDLDTGRARWRTEIDAKSWGMAGFVDGKLIVPPHLFEIDGSGRSESFPIAPNEDPIAAMSLGKLYLYEGRDAQGRGDLRCYDLESGTRIATGIGGASARRLSRIVQAATRSRLIYGSEPNRIGLVTLPEFEPRWSAELPAMQARLPAHQVMICDGRVVANVAPDVVVCLDLASGQEVWRRGATSEDAAEVTEEALQYLACDGERVFLAGGQGGHGAVRALSLRDGEPLWRYRSPHPRGYVSRVVVSGDRLFGESDGEVVAWDARSGEVVWRCAGIGGALQVMMGFGKLLLIGAGGETLCLAVGRSAAGD